MVECHQTSQECSLGGPFQRIPFHAEFWLPYDQKEKNLNFFRNDFHNVTYTVGILDFFMQKRDFKDVVCHMINRILYLCSCSIEFIKLIAKK